MIAYLVSDRIPSEKSTSSQSRRLSRGRFFVIQIGDNSLDYELIKQVTLEIEGSQDIKRQRNMLVQLKTRR